MNFLVRFDLFFMQDSGNTLDLLRNSQALALESYRVWDQIWQDFFASELWTGLVVVGLFIAAFGLITAALQWLPDLTSQNFDGRRTFQLFAPIIIVVILLTNEGNILRGLLIGLRELGAQLVNLPLRLQIADTTMELIMAQLSQEGQALEALKRLFLSCDGRAITEYEACIQASLAASQGILAQDQLNDAGVLDRVRVLVDTFGAAVQERAQNGAFQVGGITPNPGGPVGPVLAPGSLPPSNPGPGGLNPDALQSFAQSCKSFGRKPY